MGARRSVVIIHGPNLNLLGRRSPEIYGHASFEQTVEKLRRRFSNLDITFRQSNHEGQLIDWLHAYGFDVDGIVLNAGGYAHTSIALRDAVDAITSPVINVHISDIHQRESFRHQDMLADVCRHSIIGQGRDGYAQALEFLSASW